MRLRISGLGGDAGASWEIAAALLRLNRRAWFAIQRAHPSPAAAGTEELIISLALAAMIEFELLEILQL